MNRRTFLYSAVTAPLAAQPAARIRIAFLGNTHPHAAPKIKLVRESPLYELVAVCEDSASQARVLADRSIAVVAVESDVKDHAAQARAALQAGKHVHLEKAPAADLAGLRELLALAAKQRLILQHGYMWRHHPGINKALEVARAGALGEILMVRGTMGTQLGPAPRQQIAGFRGGQMFELGGHLIDPMVRLLGRPSKVTPALQKLGTDGLADNTAAMLEFPRAIGMIACMSNQPGASRQRTFEIFGTKGNAIVRPIEPAALAIDAQTIALPPYTRYVDDFVQLAEAVRTGKPLPITAEEELNVQEALLAASGMAG
jgi:predicted dehydrogenase